MSLRLRAWIVLLLVSVISFRLVTVYTMAGDPSRADHVSRRSVHPADVRATHVRGAHERLAQHLSDRPAFDVTPATASSFNPLTDGRFAPRLVSSYPRSWSSLHLTI